MAPKKKSFGLRLRTRGGTTVRKRWTKAKLSQRNENICPRCGIKAVRRASVGIWRCEKCGYTFAGGAYVPKTRLTRVIR